MGEHSGLGLLPGRVHPLSGDRAGRYRTPAGTSSISCKTHPCLQGLHSGRLRLFQPQLLLRAGRSSAICLASTEYGLTLCQQSSGAAACTACSSTRKRARPWASDSAKFRRALPMSDIYSSIPPSTCAAARWSGLSQGDPHRQTVYRRRSGRHGPPLAGRRRTLAARGQPGWRFEEPSDANRAALRADPANGLLLSNRSLRSSSAAGCARWTTSSQALSLGVSRVILGTASGQHPEILQAAIERFWPRADRSRDRMCADGEVTAARLAGRQLGSTRSTCA